MLDLEAIKERRSVTPPALWAGVPMTLTRTADLDVLIAEVELLRGDRAWLGSEFARADNRATAMTAERDEAREWARQLRAKRDRWHNAATVLSVEFATADDQRIAACEELARLRDELQALSWIAKRIEDMANESFQEMLNDKAELMRYDREKLIAATGSCKKRSE